jgi:transposase-like protein
MLGPVTPAKSENFLQQFKKAVSERALGAEMNHHLGYARREAKPVRAPIIAMAKVRTLALCA